MNNEEMTEKEMWAKLPALKDLDRVEMLLELSQKAAARNRPKDALALVNQAGQLLQICEGPDELIRKALGVESEYLASLDRKDEAVAILVTQSSIACLSLQLIACMIHSLC
jgi:hypothetical protein